MSEHTKIFDYTVDGLAYTVTVYEQDGAFFADITMVEGAMDVNAVYFGDSTFSGQSAGLKGPLNMNGGGSVYEGERVQWDEAAQLSDPGLGPEGTDKETFISAGDTLTVSLSIDSLDDIDLFGIRATSTTTDEGSIKAVSGDPVTPEEPEEPGDPTYDKVFFADSFDANGTPISGFSILSEEPEENPFDIPALPEGTEPTFENYLTHFVDIGGDVTQVQSVIFYQNDAEGVPQEEFRIDAPEDGFLDAAELLEAYDTTVDAMESDASTDSSTDSAEPEIAADPEASELIAAISLAPQPEDALPLPEEAVEDDEMMGV